ncbi:hypothetical protein [Corallococcus silvisoli]|uniref:hypothetical protein n=1 Tax=Corallococcus silvisoli TaxID=2697031 RepID=UPI0013773F0B|nr:hypothetical protein [Corallococcus silvisoli]NBD10077.1 hypothetical protein [Corallococcus silvisoli]
MSRIVWSVGGTGVVLSCIALAWLHRPVMVHLETVPTASVSSRRTAPARPDSRGVRTAPPADLSAQEPTSTTQGAEPSPEAFLDAALATQGPLQPELRGRARRVLPDTRLRLVAALRADHPSAQARRDAVLAELTASGVSTEPWTRGARAALDAWQARIHQDVRTLQAEPARCYAAGCLTRVTFPDEASFRDAWARTSELTPSADSAHLQLPPEHLPSGEVRVPWLVLRPDRPQPSPAAPLQGVTP